MSNHNDTIAECSIDAVEFIEQGKYSEFTGMINQIFESKLAAIAEAENVEIPDSEINESDEVNEQGPKIVTKVNYLGHKRKKLKCGPGRKLVNGACVAITGVEKLHSREGHRKMAKTKKGKGAGYLLKVKKKARKAADKRHQQGLK